MPCAFGALRYDGSFELYYEGRPVRSCTIPCMRFAFLGRVETAREIRISVFGSWLSLESMVEGAFWCRRFGRRCLLR